ncbi:MAG: hypothetical protein R3F46_14880 [bacterium]
MTDPKDKNNKDHDSRNKNSDLIFERGVIKGLVPDSSRPEPEVMEDDED